MTSIPETNTTALREQIKATILACVPRVQNKAAGRWRYQDKEGAGGTRVFSIAIAEDEQTPGGLIGRGLYDCTATLMITTYYNVRESRQEIVGDDRLQLREEIMKLRGPSSGLIAVESAGSTIDDQATGDSILVVHTFQIRYMRATEVD